MKTGRYTLEKKNNDIEAVKKLELQSRMNDDGSMRLRSEREKELDRVINGFTKVFIAQSMCQPKFIEESLKWEADFLVSYHCVQVVIKVSSYQINCMLYLIGVKY